MQIIRGVRCDGVADVPSIMPCRDEMKYQMSNNFPQLNDSKAEIIIITPPGLCTSNIYNLSIHLGVEYL